MERKRQGSQGIYFSVKAGIISPYMCYRCKEGMI